jgi:hypothetical protein
MSRILLALALALALVAGMAGPAMAEPVTLTVTAVQAFLATTVAGTTLTIGTALQLSLIAAGIGFSLLGSGGKRQQTVDPGKSKNTFETAESAELRAIGRVRVGGVKLFGNTVGVDRFRLIAQCRGPIDAVEQHYLGGREVIVEQDGAVSSPPYARPGGSYVFVRRKPGDGTETAWSQLTAAFPALWSGDHRARGIAQVLLHYVSPGIQEPKFLKMYQNGAPDYEAVLRGELMYDPRDGATRWSDNGILGVLHIMLTFPDIELADFDLPFVAAEAARADILVATRTGTEKRARISGVWESEIARGDLLKQVLASVGAEIVPRPGDLHGIALIDDERQPEMAILADDIVNLSLRYGPEGVERPNRCRVKYYAPERNYELAEIDMTGVAWARIDDEIERYGEQVAEYTLPFCPSAAQAQRIARRLFAVARARGGVLKTNSAGIAVWGARAIAVPLPDLDRTETCIISPPRPDEDAGEVEIPFIIWPSLSPWNPASDEAQAPAAIPELGYESSMTQPAAPTAATVVTYPDTSKETRVAYVMPGDATIAEASFRIVTGAPLPWQSMTEYAAPDGFKMAYTGDQTGQTLEFRTRGFNDDEDGSLWSPTFTATIAVNNVAPDAPAIAADVVVTGTGEDEVRIATIVVTAPDNLRVASLYIDGPDAPGTIPIRPVQAVEFDSVLPAAIVGATQTVTWTAQAKVSNGTGSSIVSVTVTIPPLPDP